MIIRKYKPCDLKEIVDLFYNTVHTINAKDYTKEQLDAWTGKKIEIDLEKWGKSFQEHYSIVAVDNNGKVNNSKASNNGNGIINDYCNISAQSNTSNIIIGFGDIDDKGYLDRLYVHKDYQRQGIASSICDKLEQNVQGKIITHASLTAKPFFEKRGYRVRKKQQVERNGVLLTNFIMEKGV